MARESIRRREVGRRRGAPAEDLRESDEPPHRRRSTLDQIWEGR